MEGAQRTKRRRAPFARSRKIDAGRATIDRVRSTLPEMSHMNSMRRFAFIFLGFTTAAMAAEYPNKPIRIVTGTPGGGLDLTARVMAPGLTAALGQQIIVDNRTFAVAPPTVAKALPDGYTLLLYGSPFWLAPFMRDDVSYDPIKDFAPIALTVSGPNVLVVNPSVPAKSI